MPADALRDGPTCLRPWRETDIQALAAAAQDPDIARWTSVPANYRETDARLYILHRLDGLRTGTYAPFAIVAPEDAGAVLLGSISVLRIVAEQRRGEIGYWLAAAARGRGHATRAVRLLSDWAFESLGLERLDLMVASANRPSQAVAERSGFLREATLRSHSLQRGERQDIVMFGLLRP